MVTFTVDLQVVGKVVFLIYALGMAGFFGYMIGSMKGFDQAKEIYGK